MKLKCDCETHFLDVDKYGDKNYKYLLLVIKEIYSRKGRKLKNPKCTSDVILKPKEIKKLRDYLNKCLT